jgi:hypothetical protein
MAHFLIQINSVYVVRPMSLRSTAMRLWALGLWLCILLYVDIYVPRERTASNFRAHVRMLRNCFSYTAMKVVMKHKVNRSVGRSNPVCSSETTVFVYETKLSRPETEQEPP